jgi:hypothetical protein
MNPPAPPPPPNDSAPPPPPPITNTSTTLVPFGTLNVLAPVAVNVCVVYVMPGLCAVVPTAAATASDEFTSVDFKIAIFNPF